MFRELNRLHITGPIDVCTPKCVLIEILDAHGIGYSPYFFTSTKGRYSILLAIEKTPIQVVHEPYSKTDLSLIHRFINKDESWDSKKLNLAFNFCINFDSSTTLTPNDVTGLQTNKYIKSLNACMLYAMCKTNNIELNFDVSIENMRLLLLMNLTSKTSLMFQLLCHTGNWKPKDILSKQILEETSFESNPMSNCSSVIAAAKRFKIDISLASNPYLEYYQCEKQGKNYVPFDEHLKLGWDRNPKWNLLSNYFNPLLPQHVYDDDQLIYLCERFGYNRSDAILSGSYFLLNEFSSSDNFILGRYGYLNSENTVVCFHEPHETPLYTLLSFGSPINGYNLITFEELYDCFRRMNNLINPMNERNELFSINVISSLKTCCKKAIPCEPNEHRELRKNLFDLICVLSDRIYIRDENSMNLKKYLSSHSTEIKNSLINLFEVSMYMRGWDGNREYPIESTPLRVCDPIQNELLVNNDTCIAITKFTESLDHLPSRSLILDLPISIFKQQFRSPSLDEPQTIGQKISIILSSRNTNDGCIRMASNWLASTAYRYLSFCNFECLFDITSLREVF